MNKLIYEEGYFKAPFISSFPGVNNLTQQDEIPEPKKFLIKPLNKPDNETKVKYLTTLEIQFELEKINKEEWIIPEGKMFLSETLFQFNLKTSKAILKLSFDSLGPQYILFGLVNDEEKLISNLCYFKINVEV